MNRLNYDRMKFKELCQKYNFSLVILHGSHANGMAIDKSDIDVGFLGEPHIVRDKYLDILRDFTDILWAVLIFFKRAQLIR